MGRVDGKVALVTGGAKGLGLASARALVAEGARVMITDVDAASGEAAARELGSNAVFRNQDVTDGNSWEATPWTMLLPASEESAFLSTAPGSVRSSAWKKSRTPNGTAPSTSI